jgi:peptide deformylase
MAIRPIVLIGDEVLRQKARRVRDFDAKLHTLLDDMRETLNDAEGVGLAAPQVGVSQRVLIVQLPDDEEEYGPEAGVFYEIVNPEIVKSAREQVEGVEACLSIPGYFGTVDRSQSVVVRGQDRHGKEFRVKAYDWLARVFQHEIDHLDGILYIDLTDDVWKVDEEPPVRSSAVKAPSEQAPAD